MWDLCQRPIHSARSVDLSFLHPLSGYILECLARYKGGAPGMSTLASVQVPRKLRGFLHGVRYRSERASISLSDVDPIF